MTRTSRNDRALQRLCIAGVSATTVLAGLPLLAATAAQAATTDVELFAPFQANTLTSNTDGTDTTTRLLADAPASVVAVAYSYRVLTGGNPTGAVVPISTATARPFTADFSTLSIANGTAIRLSATGTNSAGGVVSTDTTDVTVNNAAAGVNVTTPSGAAATIGRFNGRIIVGGTVTPGYTGAVTVADVLGTAAGPAVAANGTRTATPLNGAFSALVPTYTATSATAFVNASISTGGRAPVITDDTETATVYEQAVSAPALAPSSISSVPGGAATSVTATVLDQNGKPVGGALVDLDVNPSDAAVTDTETTNTAGQVTFSVPAPTTAGSRQISFIANQDQTSGLNSAAGDKATTVTQTTTTPVVTGAAITSLDTTPSTAAPGSAAAPFPAFPAGSTSFDIAGEDPTVRVNLTDQGGAPQATAVDVSYRVTFDPEGTNVVNGVDVLGPRRTDGGPATGYATGRSNAQGSFDVPDNLIGADAVTGTPVVASREGTYRVEAFVNRDADVAPGSGDVLATPVTYTFDGAALVSDAGATSQSEAGTSTTRAFTYALANGTALAGHLVNLSLDGAAPNPATDARAVFAATQPTGTTRTGDRAAYAVTQADGKVTAAVTDPPSTSGTPAQQDEETVTLSGTVASATSRTASTAIAFIRGATPSLVRLTQVQFPYGGEAATPGRPVTLTVNVSNGSTTAPGTSLGGQTVALSTDRGYFTSRNAGATASDDGVTSADQLVPAATPTAAGTPVGAYARSAAGKTLTTAANGTVRFTVAIDKDTDFDDDGLATATVSLRVGNVTRTLPVVFSTDGNSVNDVTVAAGDTTDLDTAGAEPLNPSATAPLTIAPVPADAVLANRPASSEDAGFQVVAFDAFGNRAEVAATVSTDNGTIDPTPTTAGGDVKTTPLRSSYTGAGASFSADSSLPDFQTSGTAEATETQTLSATRSATTLVYRDSDLITPGFQAPAAPAVPPTTTGTITTADSQVVSYYSPQASAFRFAFASTPGNRVPVNSAVNTVVTATDGRGNPVAGLSTRFLRSGPGEQTGDNGANPVVTNAAGQAGFTFTSPVTGRAVITVIVTTAGGIELSRGVQNVDFVSGTVPTGPVINGATQRFTPFGAPLVLTGRTTSGAGPVAVFFDRRGPEGARQVATVQANAAGNWSATFRPGDDYSVYTVVNGVRSNTVLAFTSPTVSGPATQVGRRGGTIVLAGRGAPGTSVDLSFRRQGTSTFSIKSRVTVGANGVWTRPLSLKVNYAFYAQRTAGAPRTGIYTAVGR